jgi:hypothetical protein
LTCIYTDERPDLCRELPNWMFDEGYCAGKQNHNRRSTRHNALMSVRLLPLFEVDIPVLILLLLFDLSFRWLVHLLDIRRVVLLTRVI